MSQHPIIKGSMNLIQYSRRAAFGALFLLAANVIQNASLKSHKYTSLTLGNKIKESLVYYQLSITLNVE